MPGWVTEDGGRGGAVTEYEVAEVLSGKERGIIQALCNRLKIVRESWVFISAYESSCKMSDKR